MNATASFEDEVGQRLNVVMERDDRSGRWETFLRHSAHGRGASNYHPNQRVAAAVFAQLVRRVRLLGWTLRVSSSARISEQAQMTVGHDGERLFRDRRTGLLIKDESCQHPSRGLPVRSLTPTRPTRPTPVDAFDLTSLPRAR